MFGIFLYGFGLTIVDYTVQFWDCSVTSPRGTWNAVEETVREGSAGRGLLSAFQLMLGSSVRVSLKQCIRQYMFSMTRVEEIARDISNE